MVMGGLIYCYLIINTLIWSAVIYLFFIIRIAFPIPYLKKATVYLSSLTVEAWIGFNNFIIRLIYRDCWDIKLPENLKRDESYLLICNHQSSLDTVLIEFLFNKKVPFLKFFIKSQLIWLPLIGVCFWMLDFPFMKRYSRKKLKLNPALLAANIQNAKKTLLKYENNSVTLINFLEGTRFSSDKHDKQNSPYKYLLKPQVGGVATAIGALPGKFKSVINVTIVYLNPKRSLWGFLTAESKKIVVRADLIEIPVNFHKGDYQNDRAYKKEFRNWINDIWQKKDEEIKSILSG